MPMFLGEHAHRLDDKSRLTLPAKFREQLGASCVMTRGIEPCVFVYTAVSWQAIAARLKQLPLMKAEARAFARLFFASAVECDLDKHGRIVVPDGLRAYAQLEKECVVVGVDERIELWAQAVWQPYVAQSAEQFSALAAALFDEQCGW
jgi:MraZ protein